MGNTFPFPSTATILLPSPALWDLQRMEEEGSLRLERPWKKLGTVSGRGLPDSRLLNKEQKDPSGVMLTAGLHPPTAALRARRLAAETG